MVWTRKGILMARYYLKKDGRVVEKTDCVHVAKSMAERMGAQLWRCTPNGDYMVTDYAKPTRCGGGDGK